jgi:N-terminal region of Chorein or VPS13
VELQLDLLQLSWLWSDLIKRSAVNDVTPNQPWLVRKKMFPLPNKLVKYLLKSTIGKLIESDFDWDAVEIQLLNGTAILTDLALNKQVMQRLTGLVAAKCKREFWIPRRQN